MQWEIQQAEAIPQSKHKLLTVIAYSTGGNVVQREVRWAESKVWILLHLCAFLVCVLFTASKWICKKLSFSSVALHDMAATQKKKKKKIQVTENRNLLLLEVFPQSRRFCIISYKSPIQTELMEYTLKQPPPPWPLNSHANKMYKYKEEENCKVHSLAGMGCWNISKVLQECETCNYGLYLFCGVKFAMLISDTEKQKSTGTVYSRGGAWLKWRCRVCKSPASSII